MVDRGLAQQTVLFAAAALVVHPVGANPDRDMLMGILAEYLPAARRSPGVLLGVIRAAEAVLEQTHPTGTALALLELSHALQGYFRMRLGDALDVLKT